MADITKQDLDQLSSILTTLFDWSGITDESPDDTEIMSNPYNPNQVITLGDLRMAIGTMRELEELVRAHSKK
jgi:hypothetical protein